MKKIKAECTECNLIQTIINPSTDKERGKTYINKKDNCVSLNCENNEFRILDYNY